MTATSMFPNYQWTLLVLLACFAGLRAETETEPSTAKLLARIEALEKRGLQADTGPSKTELLARIEELEKQGIDRRSRHVLDNSSVAFFVRMTTSLAHFGKHQNVLYDTVLANIGGGYHSDRGLFIAPVSGIYIFSTSIASDVKPHNMVEVELEVNGHTIAAAFAHSELTEHDQGSVTAVIPLAASDEVWTRIGWPSQDVEVYGSGLSTFTGCLIKPTA